MRLRSMARSIGQQYRKGPDRLVYQMLTVPPRTPPRLRNTRLQCQHQLLKFVSRGHGHLLRYITVSTVTATHKVPSRLRCRKFEVWIKRYRCTSTSLHQSQHLSEVQRATSPCIASSNFNKTRCMFVL